MPTLTFTAGNDTYVVAAAGTYNLTFLAGNDTLTTLHASATTTADMGDGNDIVSHRGGTANVIGGTGADRFEIYASGLTADGGADADLFNIRGGSGLSLTGGAGDDRFNFAVASTNILIHGGIGDDAFAGANFASTGAIHGDGGNDLFTGFRSGVTLYGGAGNDTYRANPLSGATFVELAGAGADIVQLIRGADYVLPDNIERVVVGTYAGSDTSSATIGLNSLANVFTGHGNAETVYGFGGNDRIFGKLGNDTLNGDGGNDIVDGGAGDDLLNGGEGDDTLVGREGADTMTGGIGNDTYYVDSLTDVVSEAVGEGTDTVRLDLSQVDPYSLPDNVENCIVITSDGLPPVEGNALGNLMIGNAADNSLRGRDGNDILRGGAGNDELFAGFDDDILLGGSGGDTLFGGFGFDVYVYLLVSDSLPANRDSITDFDTAADGGGGDKIDLSAIDANVNVAGNQAFTWKTVPSAAGDLWFSSDGTNIYVNADVDGDLFADFQIYVPNTAGLLSTADFVF